MRTHLTDGRLMLEQSESDLQCLPMPFCRRLVYGIYEHLPGYMINDIKPVSCCMSSTILSVVS